MTGPYKSQTILLTLFVFIAAFFSAMSGQASAATKPVQVGGEGTSQISGFSINITKYELKPYDPTRLTRIHLNVVAGNGIDSAKYVSITVDQGVTWVICTLYSGNSWVCEFSPGNEPAIRDYTQLRVVANN